MSAELHPTALCEARSVGPGSRVHAFARVGPEVELGGGCVVGVHAMLEGPVVLADGVRIDAGARLLGAVRVGPGASIGANAVVGGVETVEIGRDAVVRPGAVVAENVPANAIVGGNPATIQAYVDSERRPSAEGEPSAEASGVRDVSVRGVEIHALTRARDLRGALTALEFEHLPFAPRRLFTVHDVPSESVRGSHAHRECAQFLVCLAGALSCLVDDGTAREEIRLDRPDVGLYIPPMVWSTQWRYSRDAVLLVLASHPYDPHDYIRHYEEFLSLVERPGQR